MFLLKLVPDQTSIPFTKFRLPAMIFSCLMAIASLVAVSTIGLNFGIDFRGGVTIEIGSDAPLDIGEIRATVDTLGLGDVNVQSFTYRSAEGETDEGIVISVEEQHISSSETAAAAAAEDAAAKAAEEAGTAVPEKAQERAQQSAAQAVQEALTAKYGDAINFRKIDVVGPKVSGELVQNGALAVALAVAMMLIYIWLRFEWQFSLGAVIALVHDVVLTIGVFSVTQLEFNLQIIAAILTIVGYSMNDTVIVYDRVRENLRKYKKMPLADLVDLSVNDTLSRTVMTSGTTLLALGALEVFGGGVLRGFTFAMIWGIFVGTYSSVYIASPFLLLTGVKRDWSKAAAAKA